MTSKNISLSILIPTYNRPKELGRLLESIRKNSLEKICKYEIRIYDNNSNKKLSKSINSI